MTDPASSDALARLLSVVERELESLFGPEGFHRWGERAFMRVEGGAVLFLVVTPLREDALLNVRCYLVRDVERPDAELGDYLAHLNADQIFGAFSIDEDSDVCYDYTILGSTVTPDIISLAIGVVAQAALQYAPEIIARWGGISSLERLRLELDGEEPESEEPLN